MNVSNLSVEELDKALVTESCYIRRVPNDHCIVINLIVVQAYCSRLGINGFMSQHFAHH